MNKTQKLMHQVGMKELEQLVKNPIFFDILKMNLNWLIEDGETGAEYDDNMMVLLIYHLDKNNVEYAYVEQLGDVVYINVNKDQNEKIKTIIDSIY